MEALDAAMSRYVDGDRAAFGEVYAAVAPRLRAFLARRSVPANEVDDLLQLVFLRAHRARGRFDATQGLRPWLYAIARRLVQDRHRGLARRGRVFADGAFEAVDPGPTALDLVEGRRRYAAFLKAFRALPLSQRGSFEGVRLEGRSVDEVARALGVSPQAVKSRTHRASEALRVACSSEVSA